MGEENSTGGVNDADRAIAGSNKGLVVGAVFLGRLGHEADVGDRAHGLGIEGPVLFAEVDRGLVDAGIAAVGDDAEGVLGLAGAVIHLAAGADHRGHGGIDDDIAGDIEVGDALVGVDHGDLGTRGVDGGNIGLDRGLLVSGERCNLGAEVAETVVQVDIQGGERGGVLLEDRGEEDADREAEEDGVGDLHHRGFEVQREEDAGFLRGGDLLGVERAEGLLAHEGRIENLAGEKGGLFLEDNGLRGLGHNLG